MTKILLIGTFHFLESEIDFYTDEAQRLLQSLNNRLAKFNPDAIALEDAVHAQNSVDASYNKFSLNDLSNYDKMRNETLGTIFLYGGEHPITYKNESIQIGYRLGKTVGLDKVYAIDDDTVLPDMSEDGSEKVETLFKKHWGKMKFENENIIEMLKTVNSAEWSYHNHQLYLVKNEVGAGGSYAGADYFGRWYMRNLKIFANLQKLCNTYDRIFVLYGAGHLYILRELINASENMELINYREYI